MEDTALSNRTKRILIIGFVVLLLLFILLEIWRYFHSGTIVVTTNDPSYSNTVTISRVNTNPHAKDSTSTGLSAVLKQGTKKLSARLGFGTYTITVGGKVLSVSKVVTLSRHETLNYTLNAPQPSTPEPVSSASAIGVAANSSQLVYLDTSIHELSEINNQGSVSQISNQSFQSVQWSNAGYGIGQSSNGKLYVINNGSVSPLSVPESYKTNESVLYNITKNGDIYLSFDGRIYKGSESDGFTKIYSTDPDDTPSEIVGTSAGVLVFNTPDLDDDNAPSETLVSSSGKVYQLGDRINGAAWSPDNKLIALVGNNSNSVIVNSSLHQVDLLSSNDNVGSMVWVNNNTLLYSINNSIWSYNVNQRESYEVASLQNGFNITQLSLSDDNSYIYIAAQNGDNNGIFRLGLSGQSVPPVAVQVSVFFPSNLSNGACSVNYVNFTQPTLNVEAVSSSVNCQPIVESALEQDGIFANQLNINYSVSAQGE